MHFFGRQDTARRESFLLLIAFAVAMFFNALIVAVVAHWVTLLLLKFHPGVSFEMLKWGMIAALWGFVFYSCYQRWRDVGNGGYLLAATYGAELVSESSGNRGDRQLLNAVAEMAIASSQKQPACFCLRDEVSINAFVLGTKDDTALVVSQGAIDKLEREELLALVAHEFGHISNNDLTINMRLLIVLGGLNAIDEAGQDLCEESRSYKLTSRYSQHAHDGDVFSRIVASLVVGIFLRILGSTLVFSGDVIKAAFSRKREFLADAKSVQYTRATWGLASAMDKAAGSASEAALHSSYSGELSHLCFHGPWKHKLFAGLLASHPAPQSRINLVEPHFSVKQRKRASRAVVKTEGEQRKSSRVVVPVEVGVTMTHTPLHELGEPISIVLSLVISASGYNQDKSKKSYQRILKCYTSKPYPMRLISEPGIEEKLENALDSLLNQSAAQRQALLDHINEIIESDNIRMPEEEQMQQHICARLNPPAKAA